MSPGTVAVVLDMMQLGMEMMTTQTWYCPHTPMKMHPGSGTCNIITRAAVDLWRWCTVMRRPMMDKTVLPHNNYALNKTAPGPCSNHTMNVLPNAYRV